MKLLQGNTAPDVETNHPGTCNRICVHAQESMQSMNAELNGSSARNSTLNLKMFT